MNACCAGHTCDDCSICRSGVCCLTVSTGNGAKAQSSDEEPDERVREAVIASAVSTPWLSVLVRVSTMRPTLAQTITAGHERPALVPFAGDQPEALLLPRQAAEPSRLSSKSRSTSKKEA